MRIPRVLTIVTLLAGLALASDPPTGERRPMDPAAGKLVLVVHDVRDLTDDLLTLDDIAARFRAVAGEEAEVQPASNGRGLLVVRASPGAHSRLRALLETLRHRRARIVTIQAQVLETNGPIAPSLPDQGTLFLGADQVKRLLAGLGDRVRILTSPTLSCHDGQRGRISVLNQVSYVGDFEVKVALNGAVIVDPVVETLEEGIVLSVKPVLSIDGRFVTLLLQASASGVRRPIPTVRVELGGTTAVSIQVPEVTRKEWRRAVTLPRAGTVLLDLGASPREKGGRLAMLLTTAVTDLEEWTAPRKK